MSEIFKVREDYGVLLVRDMGSEYLTLDELDNLIARLIYTRDLMDMRNADQATVLQFATDNYIAELAKRSRLHYPFNHEYLEYRPGKVRSSDQPCFSGVYFVSFEDALETIKIGVSKDIYQRTKNLWSKHGHQLPVVYGYIETEDRHTLETALHKQFAEYHTEGEWFQAAPIIDWLESHL